MSTQILSKRIRAVVLICFLACFIGGPFEANCRGAFMEKILERQKKVIRDSTNCHKESLGRC
jgi:hypothetical protein